MTPISYSYTRDRSAALSAVLGWGILFALEASALSVLALIFLPTPWLRIAAVLALIGPPGSIIIGMLAPFRTHHLLTSDALLLHYGRDRLTIPRGRIASVEAVAQRQDTRYSPRFVHDPLVGRLSAVFSPHGQLLLHLDPPLDVPIRKGSFACREVLINVDDRDLLLTELDVEPAAIPTIVVSPIAQQRPLPVASGETAIDTIALTRRYGSVAAVDNLELHIRRGEIYGLLGPNGAGKTTTITMLVGLLAPTSGAIRLAGHDLALDPLATRAAFGYVPDRPILYDMLTGREFLEYVAQLRSIPTDVTQHRIARLIEMLELDRAADQLCRTYSFGMKSKLALIAALLHEPHVLILDEPFNGLDPQSSQTIQQMLRDLAANGTAILISTHDLAIAERLCHRVGIIARGRLVAEGAPDEIRIGDDAPSLEETYLAIVGGRSAQQGAPR
ncbi:MAG TPA: ABC transporter ATP-binding protein [Thermomicrobiales bacterium]|nr:ABC transporter ATP-binding protein [Thermomicrobiales bacterium]